MSFLIICPVTASSEFLLPRKSFPAPWGLLRECLFEFPAVELWNSCSHRINTWIARSWWHFCTPGSLRGGQKGTKRVPFELRQNFVDLEAWSSCCHIKKIHGCHVGFLPGLFLGSCEEFWSLLEFTTKIFFFFASRNPRGAEAFLEEIDQI